MPDHETVAMLRERKRRIVQEAEQMQRDIEHWNRMHPNEPPLPDARDLIEMAKAIPDPIPWRERGRDG